MACLFLRIFFVTGLVSSFQFLHAENNQRLVFCDQVGSLGLVGQCEGLQVLERLDSHFKAVSLASKKFRVIKNSQVYQLVQISENERLEAGTLVSLPSELFSATGTANTYTLCSVTKANAENFQAACGNETKRQVKRSLAYRMVNFSQDYSKK